MNKIIDAYADLARRDGIVFLMTGFFVVVMSIICGPLGVAVINAVRGPEITASQCAELCSRGVERYATDESGPSCACLP